MKYDPKNYAEVKDRIPFFFKKYPDGRIATRVEAYSPGLDSCVIVAMVFADRADQKDGLPLATGTAQEQRQEKCDQCDGTGKRGTERCKTCYGTGKPTGPNANCWWENCETSAIGRALANVGILGPSDLRPSREEMAKAKRNEPEPKPEPEPPPSDTKAGPKPSAKRPDATPAEKQPPASVPWFALTPDQQRARVIKRVEELMKERCWYSLPSLHERSTDEHTTGELVSIGTVLITRLTWAQYASEYRRMRGKEWVDADVDAEVANQSEREVLEAAQKRAVEGK